MTTRTIAGNNFQNNEVLVDYVRKEVRFRPVSTNGLFRTWAKFYVNLIGAGIARVVFPAALIVFLTVLLCGDWSMLSVAGAIAAALFLLTCGVLWVGVVCGLYSLLFFKESWRKTGFPQVNYLIGKCLFEERRVLVTPSMVADKEYVLAAFSNVGLHYALKGDFAFFLERVEVKSLTTTDEGEWYTVFTFSEQPVEGAMELQYI